MCGIFGRFSPIKNGEYANRGVELLRHRGPDQSNIYSEETPFGVITLGQTRLNIVDQNDIGLPVAFNSNIILFNGEIYNFISIKRELEALGWSFVTSTDTEVVLAAYLQWKEQCLDRFNGMWAIVIWDGSRLFLSRDRLGQKPLYYRQTNDSFEFSSEVKVFEHLEYTDTEQLNLFEFCFDSHTPFKDVFSLKPGHYLYYDPPKKYLTSRCYWDTTESTGRKISGTKNAIDELIELLRDSISLRTRADVPVAMFLSGGVDSALIAALSGIKNAFTCQFSEFKNDIDEEYFASDLARRLGITLDVITPTRDDFLDSLPTLAKHLEIPTGSFSVFPLYALSRQAAAAGFKVILTGEGSDELFVGYVRNEVLLSSSIEYSSEKNNQYQSMIARYNGSDLDRFCRMASRTGLAGAAQMRMYLSNFWNEEHSLTQNISHLETTVFLQPLLQMSDRMMMANSIEGRCPFLDYRLVDFARSLEDDLRYRDGSGKWLIQEAAKKVLPKDALVLKREVKHGLPTPINQWLYGQASFDRNHWATLMLSECIQCLCIR